MCQANPPTSLYETLLWCGDPPYLLNRNVFVIHFHWTEHQAVYCKSVDIMDCIAIYLCVKPACGQVYIRPFYGDPPLQRSASRHKMIRLIALLPQISLPLRLQVKTEKSVQKSFAKKSKGKSASRHKMIRLIALLPKYHSRWDCKLRLKWVFRKVSQNKIKRQKCLKKEYDKFCSFCFPQYHSRSDCKLKLKKKKVTRTKKFSEEKSLRTNVLQDKRW